MPRSPSRRQFLRFGSATAAAALLPENLKHALAIAPHTVTGTIQDVEHVVILMQENRSFDHYFGCLQGVRGYADPRAERLPDGSSVFAQPDGKGGTVLPFLFNTAHTSSACLASLDHSWKGTQTAWNDWNTWISHKGPMTMGHFTRAEIPYYYALADAFTICDAYHASLFGPTNPNRLFLFSGTSGLAVGHSGKQAVENVDDGNWSADMAHDHPDFTPFRWETYPERLQDAGVSWRVYQEYDNFGDNPLASFAQFRNLDPTSWQYRRARQIVPGSTEADMHTTEGRYLVAEFERDISEGRLPQVSWIVPPTALSEHPNAPPGYGEHLISQLMDVFVRHPDVWSRTVFILNYDENDGFFDHVPAPVPALTPEQGGGTVSTQGESYHDIPVGLGPRVPAIIVSPWTKGGWVNSQVFDHTSVLRFLEARFGVKCPNITPWRRSVCGDLTSVFDFAQTDRTWTASLPNTDDYLPETRRSCVLPHPVVPTVQKLPRQESGQRPARALPYDLHADFLIPDTLKLTNAGSQGAVFRVRANGITQHFTLDARTSLHVPVKPSDMEAITVHGPNGFYRYLRGREFPATTLQYDHKLGVLFLCLRNTMSKAQTFHINEKHAASFRTVSLTSAETQTIQWDIAPASYWYDLEILSTQRPNIVLQLSGHIETGRPGLTEPYSE